LPLASGFVPAIEWNGCRNIHHGLSYGDGYMLNDLRCWMARNAREVLLRRLLIAAHDEAQDV
jgi:hypothetical protein